MRQILILWHILILPMWLVAQNCGLEDTILIGANRSNVHYDFEITDVVNNDLANPNQGICGIEMTFRHTLSDRLEVWLTSPSGQRIQLIGPNVSTSFAFTFSTEWQINYVPCAATAMPDSGFIAQWNNIQPNNFINGGRYRGSYYPFTGCLEDFNTGPVNGTWRITFTNNPSTYLGAITDFRLRLCDERGFLCCDANPGSLAAYPDVEACEGSAALKLNLKPDYTSLVQPDTAEYGYTYMISKDGILIAYDSLADCSDLPVGNYQVCGLSYRKSDFSNFPQPDGVLRTDDFRRQLNGDSLLLCGRINNNCVDVRITNGDTTLLQRDICMGESVQVGNQTFTTTGDYFVTLPGSDGCDSTVHLRLAVVPGIVTNLDSTICAGDSVVVGSSVYKTSGTFSDTLTTVNGCDSIINLNLTVLRIQPTFISAVICQGETYSAAGQTFDSSGQYDVILTAANGCDSLVSLTLLVLNPTASIAPPDTIGCDNPVVTLDAGASGPVREINYVWTNLTGDTLGVDSILFTDIAGVYILNVTQTAGDMSCTARDTVEVISNADMPVADAGADYEINCAEPSVVIGGTNTSTGPNITYRWHIINGNIVGDTTQRTAIVDASGEYLLIVTNTISGCVDTAAATVRANFTLPVVDIEALDTLSCAQTSVTLDIGNSSRGDSIRYTWRDSTGTILGTGEQQQVNSSGKYILEVVNMENGCSARDSIIIQAGIGVPEVTFGDTIIPCNVDTFLLEAFITPPNGNYALFWTGPGVIGNGDAASTPINQEGLYILTVINLDNDCIINEFVEITKETDCDQLCVQGNLPDTLTCLQDSVLLVAFLCGPCDSCTVQWTTANGNIVSGADSLVALVNQPGTYTITIRNPAGDSASTSLEVLQTIDLPTADAGADQLLNCDQPSIGIGGTNSSNGPDFTYQWQSASGAVVTPNNTPTINVTAPDTYILEVRNTLTGCVAQDTVVVMGDTLRPTASAGLPQMLSCTDTIATLDGSGSSAGANISYTWTTLGGNIVSGADNLDPVVNAPGTYILTVTSTLNNCTAVDSVVVTSDESVPPVPTFGDEFLTCINPTVTIDASSAVGATLLGRWCQLDSNNLEINCLDNPLLVTSAAGTYRFEITDTTSGCRNTTLLRIIDNTTLPSISAGTSDTLDCVQPSLMLDATIAPANGDYSYRWTAVNGSPLSNDTILTPTVTMPDIYILEATNLTNGCVSRDSVEILQNADVPSAFAGFDTLLTCTVTSLQLTGTTLGNNLRVEWVTSTGNIVSGADSLNPVVDQPGTYFFRVTNQLSNCVAEDTVVVGQNIFAPTAGVRNSDELNLDCISNSETLDGCVSLSQTGANLRYRWQELDGGALTNPDSCNLTVTRKGDYQLFVEDLLNGCVDSVIVTVNQDPDLPTVTVASPAPITCARDTATLVAQLSDNGSDFRTSWINPRGQVLPDSTLNINVNESGNYTFVLFNIVNGCSDSTTVRVDADTTQPIVNIAPPNSLDCQIQTATLVATVSGGTRFSYTWTTTDGSILSGADASTATVDAGGNYTLVVTNLDNGCTNQAVAGVKQGESSIEQAFFTVTPANCRRQGSGFVQIDSVRGGTQPYLYSLGELPFAEFDYFQNIRAGDYTLRVQDRNGCEWETRIVIPEPEPITVELGNDTLINFGDTIQLVALLDSSRLESVQWVVNGDTTNLSNTTSAVVAPPVSSQYQIVVTATNGCTATDLINVAVTQITSVFVPNAFSPDGDGINDVFMVYAGKNVKQVKAFMIFDRWGNRLLYDGPFQPNDPAHGWDGTFNGKPMDAGVYVFYAEVEIIDGRTEIIEGGITLLR